MGTEDKIGHFRWIVGFITANSENVIWVVSGPTVLS